jgi:hypothetical protein
MKRLGTTPCSTLIPFIMMKSDSNGMMIGRNLRALLPRFLGEFEAWCLTCEMVVVSVKQWLIFEATTLGGTLVVPHKSR